MVEEGFYLLDAGMRHYKSPVDLKEMTRVQFFIYLFQRTIQQVALVLPRMQEGNFLLGIQVGNFATQNGAVCPATFDEKTLLIGGLAGLHALQQAGIGPGSGLVVLLANFFKLIQAVGQVTWVYGFEQIVHTVHFLSDLYQTRIVPATLLIETDGRIVKKLVGQKTLEELDKAFSTFLHTS